MVRKAARVLAVLALLAGTVAIVIRGSSPPAPWEDFLAPGELGIPDACARICRPIGVPWGDRRPRFIRWSTRIESNGQGGSTDADGAPRQR